MMPEGVSKEFIDIAEAFSEATLETMADELENAEHTDVRSEFASAVAHVLSQRLGDDDGDTA